MTKVKLVGGSNVRPLRVYVRRRIEKGATYGMEKLVEGDNNFGSTWKQIIGGRKEND